MEVSVQRSIQHTTRYTQLSAAPFKDFWRQRAGLRNQLVVLDDAGRPQFNGCAAGSYEGDYSAALAGMARFARKYPRSSSVVMTSPKFR
jgi:hypothetical protein